jgi:hypothetical protein
MISPQKNLGRRARLTSPAYKTIIHHARRSVKARGGQPVLEVAAKGKMQPHLFVARFSFECS